MPCSWRRGQDTVRLVADPASNPGRAPGREWTLVHLIRRQAADQGDRPFVRFEDGQSFTFRALDAWTDELASSLAALGMRAGDRVLGLVGNRAESIGMLFAAAKLGAVWVPVNTGLRGAFLQHQLHNAEPRVVVVEDRLAANLRDVAAGPVGPEAVVIIGDPTTPTPACLTGARRLMFPELRALRAPGEVPLASPAPGDVAMIMYTSGTTGPSKGVLMPHGHCYLFGLGLAEALALTPSDRYFICMPLFHANALLMQLIGSLIAGAEVVVAERFRATSWLEEVRAARATVTNGLGVIPEFIFRQPPTDRDRDHRLRAMMAVPIAEEWGAAFQERFGVPFLQGFGMTECNIVAYTRLGEPLVPGCAGYLLAEWFEVAIVDPDSDAPLPPGAVGEITVRPKVPGVLHGGLLPHAREDRRGVAQPLVSHRRRRPLRRARAGCTTSTASRTASAGAGRTSRASRSSRCSTPTRRSPSRRWSASRWRARAARTR